MGPRTRDWATYHRFGVVEVALEQGAARPRVGGAGACGALASARLRRETAPAALGARLKRDEASAPAIRKRLALLNTHIYTSRQQPATSTSHTQSGARVQKTYLSRRIVEIALKVVSTRPGPGGAVARVGEALPLAASHGSKRDGAGAAAVQEELALPGRGVVVVGRDGASARAGVGGLVTAGEAALGGAALAQRLERDGAVAAAPRERRARVGGKVVVPARERAVARAGVRGREAAVWRRGRGRRRGGGARREEHGVEEHERGELHGAGFWGWGMRGVRSGRDGGWRGGLYEGKEKL